MAINSLLRWLKIRYAPIVNGYHTGKSRIYISKTVLYFVHIICFYHHQRVSLRLCCLVSGWIPRFSRQTRKFFMVLHPLLLTKMWIAQKNVRACVTSLLVKLLGLTDRPYIFLGEGQWGAKTLWERPKGREAQFSPLNSRCLVSFMHFWKAKSIPKKDFKKL